MTAAQRGETTVGPVAVNGRTLTLVARTSAVHIGSDQRGALRVWSRPVHIEVLDADGRREVVRIHDVERTLLAAIAAAAAVCAIGARLIRRKDRS